MSLKFQKKMDEAINDELAYDIVMRHVEGANGLVAVSGLHQILRKMRNNEYSEDVTEIGYCNLKLKRVDDDVEVIVKKKPFNTVHRYNIFTYHLDKKFGKDSLHSKEKEVQK